TTTTTTITSSTPTTNCNTTTTTTITTTTSTTTTNTNTSNTINTTTAITNTSTTINTTTTTTNTITTVNTTATSTNTSTAHSSRAPDWSVTSEAIAQRRANQRLGHQHAADIAASTVLPALRIHTPDGPIRSLVYRYQRKFTATLTNHPPTIPRPPTSSPTITGRKS
ncbi:unnamed protein product, partial [Schistocephalus solidus]|uniref:COesterase domain-containing protein n=1 Tax=Schistocephalus solidus TaxID=70667 RepID=A0A183TUG1_SCHSO